MYFASSDSRYSGTLRLPSPRPHLVPYPRLYHHLGSSHLSFPLSTPRRHYHLVEYPPPPLPPSPSSDHCPGTPRCPSFFYLQRWPVFLYVCIRSRCCRSAAVAARVAILRPHGPTEPSSVYLPNVVYTVSSSSALCLSSRAYRECAWLNNTYRR